MIKTSLIQKITLSGLLLALTIIFTRFLSIQNIPVIPFVRISIGPALIIFTSLLLGPVCGAVVGAGSDILGIVLVPNALGYSINPLFTLVYGLLGVVPWLIYYLVKIVKNPRIALIIFISVLAALLVFVTIFLCLNSQIILFGKEYIFEIWHKTLIIVLSFVFSIGMSLGIFFFNRYLKNKRGDYDNEVYRYAVVCLISEILVMLILNSIVKALFFEIDFLFVFFAQAIVFFIDIVINTIVVTLLMLLSKKYIRYRLWNYLKKETITNQNQNTPFIGEFYY